MKICPKCSTQLNDNVGFCNNCGTNVKDVAPVAEAAAEDVKETVNEAAEKIAEEASEAKEAAAQVKEAAEEKAAEVVNEVKENVTEKAAEIPAAVNNAANDAASVVSDAIPTGSYNAAAGAGNAQAYAPVGNGAVPAENPALAEAKKGSKNAKIGIIAICAAVVLLLIILVAVISSAGGYKRPIKNLVNTVNHHSTKVPDFLENVAPKFAVTAYNDAYKLLAGTDLKSDMEDGLAEMFENLYDDLEDEYGSDFKVSVEFRDSKEMSDRDIKDLNNDYDDLYEMLDKSDFDWEDKYTYEDLAENLEDEYDVELSSSELKKLQKIVTTFVENLEKMEITAGYEVSIKVSIEGEDGHDSEKLTINVIKVDGNWIIDPLSLAENYGFSTSYLRYMF
mgnify:CR=1 FL=1